MHYICTYCGRGFKYGGDLQRHKRTHTEKPTHRCTDCGKTYTRSNALTIHMRTHTGERPFECEVCGKCFFVKEILSVHQRTHSQEKPYKCSHCDCSFKHSGNLYRHLRIHTGERPHRCAECGKTFILSGELTVHMRTHTGEKPYVCTLCNKGLASSRQLKIHSLSHTGERPFACDLCGKTFAHIRVLKLHQFRVHLEKRLYKCNLCAEAFNSKKALDQHIKSHKVLPIRQSITSFKQHTGAAVIPSSQPTPSSISNFREIDNNMGSSKAERLNLTSSQQSQEFSRSLNDVGKHHSISKFSHYSSNTPRRTIGEIHRHQLLDSSLLLGSALSTNQANTGSAKELLSTGSDYQRSQEQKQLIITNGNSKVDQHQYDPDSTNFRHIPPLIPIHPNTANYCSTPMISNLIESEKNEEQLVVPSPLEFYKERRGFV